MTVDKSRQVGARYAFRDGPREALREAPHEEPNKEPNKESHKEPHAELREAYREGLAGVGTVPAPNFAGIGPDDFADEDYAAPHVWVNDRRGIPYYFAHFHKLANAVRLDGPHRGFIDIAVHRNPAHNFPFNARVQENHLWLAYFYTRKAPWNLYYGMPEVKLRLEAALEHLLTLQSPEGAMSEYGWQQYNLPGTSFAVQFLGQTVRLLREAKSADAEFPFIRGELYDSVIRAYRKALAHVLDNESFWQHGKGYTNQYTLMWSATAAYLAYDPDPALERRMRERFAQAADEFLSPAGFYYEAYGYDMGYNMGVHVQNDLIGYHYFKETELEQPLIDKERRFIEWLSYNLVLEPDGSFFTANAAPSGRTPSGYYVRRDIPLAEKLPLARAFVRTREEVEAEIRMARTDIAKDGKWPNVSELTATGGNAYNPYALYNRILYRYYPTESERLAAIAELPYMANDRFNHKRIDDPNGLQFTYARRPSYYAAFNAGRRRTNLQAFGLGLLWHPAGGIWLSSQTEHSSAAASRGLSWGTKPSDRHRVYESGDVCPAYFVGGLPLAPAVGCGDIARGDVEIKYGLGTKGEKSVRFEEDGVVVTIRHPEQFEEHMPLMVAPDDQIAVEKGQVVLQRGRLALIIAFDEEAEAALTAQNGGAGRYRLHRLAIAVGDALTYSIKTVSC